MHYFLFCGKTVLVARCCIWGVSCRTAASQASKAAAQCFSLLDWLSRGCFSAVKWRRSSAVLLLVEPVSVSQTSINAAHASSSAAVYGIQVRGDKGVLAPCSRGSGMVWAQASPRLLLVGVIGGLGLESGLSSGVACGLLESRRLDVRGGIGKAGGGEVGVRSGAVSGQLADVGGGEMSVSLVDGVGGRSTFLDGPTTGGDSGGVGNNGAGLGDVGRALLMA